MQNIGVDTGTPGKNILIHGKKAVEMPGKFHANLSAGNSIRIETPGGGGFGPAENG